MYTQGSDNKFDRKLGEYWERRFCIWAAKYGKSFTPHQIGRENSAQFYKITGEKWNHYTLPDITIWSAPGDHHEIKHKGPTRHGSYGLELYRLNALLWFAKETAQDVMYTIHDHSLSGGRLSKVDDINHWYTVNVLQLERTIVFTSKGTSYVNGQVKDNIPICYWKKEYWSPLAQYWERKIIEGF